MDSGLVLRMPRNDGAHMTNPKPTITSAEPQLFVADIKSSCAFFADKLGFAIVFTYGEPPFYAQVRRGGASLTLRHVDAPVIDPTLRDREELLSGSLRSPRAPTSRRCSASTRRAASPSSSR